MSGSNTSNLRRAVTLIAFVVLLVVALVGCDSLGSIVQVAGLALPVSVDSAAPAETPKS